MPASPAGGNQREGLGTGKNARGTAPGKSEEDKLIRLSIHDGKVYNLFSIPFRNGLVFPISRIFTNITNSFTEQEMRLYGIVVYPNLIDAFHGKKGNPMENLLMIRLRVSFG